MTVVHRRFLPDRLRPRTPHRRSHRRFLLPAVVVTTGLLLVPLWTVQSVKIYGGEVIPKAATASLEGLVGHLVPTLELEWLHQVAAAWPGATEVRVHLELPGTVVVEIFPVPTRGSAPVGTGWHAVAADGRLVGAMDEPQSPRLVGFRRPSDRRLAFVVARRLAKASGGDVKGVQQITPVDFRVELRFDDQDLTTAVHVLPEGTTAEQTWCELAFNGELMVDWADLRWPNRMVLGTRATQEPLRKTV